MLCENGGRLSLSGGCNTATTSAIGLSNETSGCIAPRTLTACYISGWAALRGVLLSRRIVETFTVAIESSLHTSLQGHGTASMSAQVYYLAPQYPGDSSCS